MSNYKKVASHEAKNGEFSVCLLLYSGGLDTSVMIKWIQENYDCEIITLTLDLGQTVDDLDAIKQKALKLGAKKALVYDAKKEFADKILTKAILANADYQGGYALSTPLGRVIMAEIAVKIAKQQGVKVIAHGCTGKGNDQVRLESYILANDIEMKVIAPVREWGLGRQEEIAYAQAHNIPIKQQVDSPYSYDENMWGNTGEGGEIETVEATVDLDKVLQWVTPANKVEAPTQTIKIDFEAGLPVALNGESLSLVKMIEACNQLGSKHGIGVVQLIEDRLIGLKVRGVYENPGATILITAHKQLERLVSTREENYFKTVVDQKWAYLVYGAQWYEPLLQNLNAYQAAQNNKVSGQVSLQLNSGNVAVVAIDSPYSLLNPELATFEKNSSFNQNASAGFIELYSLPQLLAKGVKDE